MKVIVVGGTGTIGRRLVPALRSRGHDVVTAARTSGDIHVDLTAPATIEAMYRQVTAADSVISVAAHGALDEFTTLTSDRLHENLRAKFYGQVALVLTGQHHCADGASFTLTSGIFADHPWPHVTGGGVISGALHSFALSAAIELPRRMRITVVSPTLVDDPTPVEDGGTDLGRHFPGLRPIPMPDLVDHYLRCVEDNTTGTIIRAY
ncbi:short chain dehydrogenase [Actinokineospora terrae]|uniref:NAD(P)-dependent dehydrogenase, short-chain alcohol dehydrogenase family n=1 Tax=Actinokineospora terrae TaxID=155974 RepID=A0A1H9XHT0_9PSEU|nr:short chain dehydrogenase [Actinokineospora terrae]SES45702.1 NAD(P)-dependent dehydrogenase, short-chain alcohol dehydrogenase family [Actinokineospora terrae]